MTAFLLVHLSPNDLAPETHDFVHRLNRQADAYFIAQHGWILAFGNIKGLLRSDTLAGWTARRAVKAFPVWYLDDTPLLRQLNRYLKSQVRRQQKNRPGLWRQYGYKRRPYCGLISPRPSDLETFAAIAKRVVPLLRFAVSLVPVVERDGQCIYPADVDWRTWWRPERPARMPGLGLNDYTELVKLSFGGDNQIRQYAKEPARRVSAAGYIPPPLVPIETQQTLEHIERLYKFDCHYPEIGTAPLFGTPQEAQPALCIWPPRTVRLANLERTRSDYNDRWQLFQTFGRPGLSKEIRLRGSLNIPPEAQHMAENVKNDFGQSDQEEVA